MGACSDITYPADFACADLPTRERVKVSFYDNKPKKKMKIQDVSIKQLDYGYVVRVGCKEIALDKPEKILYALKQYFKDPDGVETKFLKGELKFEK